MNQEQFHKKVMQVASRIPKDERVPYAFEKRIMAQLKTGAVDSMGLWSRLLWKSVIPSVAVMILTTVVAYTTEADGPDLESAVLAPIEGVYETW